MILDILLIEGVTHWAGQIYDWSLRSQDLEIGSIDRFCNFM